MTRGGCAAILIPRDDPGPRMISPENRFPLFGIMRFPARMILPENRFPLFGIMR